MLERDEFIEFINRLKAVSPTITDEQRKGLLRQATQEYSISVTEASEILKASGLIVGENETYFEVFGISIEELQSFSEDAIISHVNAAHRKLYTTSLRAGGRPRVDGRSEEQWRTLLNQARETLIDAHKRREYVAILQNDQVDVLFEDEVPPIFELSDVDDIVRQELSYQTIPDDVDVPDDMVYIPAGEFRMGTDDEEANEDEQPVHTVFLDAFFMDKNPVTNAQYKDFLDANPQWHKPPKWYERGKKYIESIANKYHDGDYLKHWTRNNYPRRQADHPVTWISWYAAMAYAKWVGKRLPTEAEWEKAARGGLVGNKYPWGNSIGPIYLNYDLYIGKTTSVVKYPANGYGLYDIVGNVFEWCLDRWDKGFYANSPRNNPISDDNIVNVIDNFTNVNTSRVLRGGSCVSTPQNTRVAYRHRNTPVFTCFTFGFRCVKSV